MSKYRSWAYIPESIQEAKIPAWSDFELDLNANSLLPHGNARSYGDSCLNSEGLLIESRLLNRFIKFDESTGILRCESGILFSEILELIVPKNWFLPVTPGTKYITLGGAVANDVHGKNHHQDGSFGRHICSFELKRSDGKKIICSKEKNPELFSATIGGLGLTGFISWVEIQLIKIPSPFIRVKTTPFHGLEEFYTLSENAKKSQYSVAWLDCSSTGNQFARGLFMTGDHTSSTKTVKAIMMKPKLSIPFNFPQKVLNRYSIKAFNSLYFNKNSFSSSDVNCQHYDAFFYPLDGIGDWNRIYGNKGFYQYQFVVPMSEKATMEKILEKIVESGLGSFLAVLKEFGDLPSPGMMSFPRKGICLALDFANRGDVTLKLIAELDQMVIEAGGAAYPAKDVRMTSEAFQVYYPNIKKFKQLIDPKFSSDFWRRVSEA